MLLRHNKIDPQHVLETSETCCEKRGDDEEDQQPLLERAHCLDTTHIREGLLARRVEQKRRAGGRRVEHGRRVLRDQAHGHGDIKAVLRKEPSDITLPVALDTGLRADVRHRRDIEEPEDEEEDKSGEKELLTLHCVFPQKNGS